jgi:uncharacterized protein YdeI (YjbR/CyaY-like superfamily)
MEYTPSFYANSRSSWRKWLEKNHEKEQKIWLIIYKKESGKPSVYYSEAVDEALCFGWIDSAPRKRDEESYYQYFTKRSPKSNWSVVNKNKVAKLMEQGLMTDAGLAMVELAKKSGTWNSLDKVHNLDLPEDLQKALAKNKRAQANWETFAPSARRGILEWILNAKRPETRLKRINETVALASQNIKANQGKQKS